MQNGAGTHNQKDANLLFITDFGFTICVFTELNPLYQ